MRQRSCFAKHRRHTCGCAAGVISALFVCAAIAPGQTKSAATGPQRLEITLERREGRKWNVVPGGLVFQKNDQVRFRMQPNFDGYLYVMNYGTSGQYTMLFPREETGFQNQIKTGVEYIVPATKPHSALTVRPVRTSFIGSCHRCP